MGFLQAVNESWKGLSVAHKAILVLLCMLCAGALAAVVWWAGRPQYELLYGGLGPDESAALVTKLQEEGISVEVSRAGTAVMVPRRDKHKARMLAAEKGILKRGGSGFEAFREPKIGMTPFAEHVSYVDALQNELATTIMSLDTVRFARVHLVLPEEQLFKNEEKTPTASVLLACEPGASITGGQVVSIGNLVASAVEGLTPKNVTVIDENGNALSGGGGEGPQMAAGDQFSYRRQVESYLSAKARRMLAAVLGPNRCEVDVSAELDFHDLRETTKQYDPDKRVVVSEHLHTDKSTGASSEVGGPVGTGAAAEAQQTVATTSAPAARESKTEDIKTEYLVSQSVRETVKRGAEIKRLAVAAFVDLSSPDGTESAETPAEGPGNTEAAGGAPTIEEVRQIIRDAVGFDEERGDSLVVVEAPFHSLPAAAAEVGAHKDMDWLIDGGKYFAIGALALVLFLLARGVLKGLGSASSAPEVTAELMGPEAGRVTVPGKGGEYELARRAIAAFVERDPETAGRMLEGWVEGEE